MGNAASPSYVSYEDYLVLEVSSDAKHEWCDGVVYAMSRGTPKHARLSAAIGRRLGTRSERSARSYSSDAMLWIERANLSTYADATVVCGPLETKKVTKKGKSARRGDRQTDDHRGGPLRIHRALPTATGSSKRTSRLPRLKEYVSSRRTSGASRFYRRGEGSWTCETAGAGGRVKIHGRAVKVDDVYG